MTQVSAKPFELVAAFDRAAYDVMPLIDFCETFFREFIADVLSRQVQAFDRSEARQVAKAARGATKEVDGVLRLFGSFCDTYDNVSHLSYVAMMEGGATNRELTHFVDSYMPQLLEAIHTWAAENSHDEVADASLDAQYTYELGLMNTVDASEEVSEAPPVRESSESQDDAVAGDPFPEIIRLLEREQDLGSSVGAGMVGNSFTVRGWAVTVWGALLGFAIDKNAWSIAVLAIVAVLAFAALDAYYTWLYGRARDHVVRVERLTRTYYSALLADDLMYEPLIGKFVDEAAQFQPGLWSSFPRYNVRAVSIELRRWYFRVVYPGLMLVAAAISALLGFDAL